MEMLTCSPRLTWSVLKHGRSIAKHIRCLCVPPTALYDTPETWPTLLQRQQILEIEKHWKGHVRREMEARPVAEQADGEKFYVLSMFPYPSGKLHMGHVRVYTISDMMARYHRMLGHKVIHPMGWDAFGLPAENAAIERNLHPKQWTYSNIGTMRKQLDDLCCSFDWNREVNTCDSAYYRWTQYIFLKMYEAGIVYQREASVNWDPVDQTVLADEQIDEHGRSWRSGAVVEKRYLKQWYIRTTAYAKSLWEGLDMVRSDLWKDVIQMQKNWIGPCTGCRLDFKLMLDGSDFDDILSVYTSQPECVHGVSHIALSPLHRYNDPRFYTKKDVADCTDRRLLTLSAVNPVTGQQIPVIVTDITHEHNDAFLGIPCENDADRHLADDMGLPWKPVLEGDPDHQVLINSGQLDGMTRIEASNQVMQEARDGGFGGHPVSEHLKDWLISRQRYWGTPIPVVHCESCKAVPVPFEDLPVVLPDSTRPTIGKGQSPLLEDKDWLNTKCPRCGGPARRETDTMDTFVDSSWYFLRYLDPSNTHEPVSRTATDRDMPVDLYIGGKEHAYLHLYYARFFNHFLCDEGLTPHREPFVNLLTQGMVKGQSYKVQGSGVYVAPEQVEQQGRVTYQSYKVQGSGVYVAPEQVEQQGGTYVVKETGEKVVVQYEKMSKSKHNGVDPQRLLEEYGVDLTRLCILSNVAPKSDRNWNNDVYVGAQKWLNRVWSLIGILVQRSQVRDQPREQDLVQWDRQIRAFHNRYLLEIQHHLNKTFLLNTAISRMHELTSDLKKVPAEVAVCSEAFQHCVCDLVMLLAPFAPIISCEMWSMLGTVVSRVPYNMALDVHHQRWPSVDSDGEIPLTVQCNEDTLGAVYLPICDVELLSKEQALALAETQTFYQEVVKTHAVSGVSLNVAENFRAKLQLRVPELEKKTKKKKKKMKEKSAKTMDAGKM